MSDERMPEKEPVANKGSQSIAQMLKESVADGRKVIESTEEVIGSSRQIVDAGFLGTCIVFFAAMLGLQQNQIDAPLTTALVAFAVAIPMLVYGFTYASSKANPAPGWRLLVALQAGSVIVETFGQIAVAVGVFAIIALRFYPYYGNRCESYRGSAFSLEASLEQASTKMIELNLQDIVAVIRICEAYRDSEYANLNSCQKRNQLDQPLSPAVPS